MSKSEPENNPFAFCRMETGGGKVASCAACCGMYNWRGFNRDMVGEELARRTELLMEWDGTDAGIERIRKELAGSGPRPLCSMIVNCEFMGFLDEARTRVGCLLHPSMRNGKNLREYSKHGRSTCDEARCTAYQYLDEDIVRCVALAADDSYLYGLCLTDIDLLKGFFAAASEYLHETISPARVSASPALLELFRGYLCLKGCWPFARDPGRFGKYFFPNGTYRIASIDYQGLGMEPSRYDKILLSLGSVFHTGDEVAEAESMIEERIEKFANACAGGLET